MKKIFHTSVFAAIVMSLFTFSSCTKEDVVVVQNLGEISQCLTYDTHEHTTPYVFSFNKTDVESAFAAAGATFDLEKIKNAKLSEIKAEVTTTAATFNDIGGFELYLRKPGATLDQEVQVAYINNIDNNATEVTMKINGTDFKSLLSENTLELVLRLTNKEGSGAPVCIKIKDGKLAYTVSAK